MARSAKQIAAQKKATLASAAKRKRVGAPRSRSNRTALARLDFHSVAGTYRKKPRKVSRWTIGHRGGF